MVKYKIAIQFDKDFLNKLKQESDSGVEIRKSEHHVALHPIQLNNFNESVKDLLSEGIAKYNRNLEGILLGYQNIKLLSNEGYICDDSCYIHLDLRADFFIFKPEIDKEMQGLVNRKSKDHVGLLVYNAFNVSIPRPRTDLNWLGTSVIIGNKVQFKITYIHLSSCMPFIKGELLSILSEIDDVKDNSAQFMNKSKNHKKQKTDIENGLGIKHKSKKRKATKESREAETSTIEKSKRKKHIQQEIDIENRLGIKHKSKKSKATQDSREAGNKYRTEVQKKKLIKQEIDIENRLGIKHKSKKSKASQDSSEAETSTIEKSKRKKHKAKKFIRRFQSIDH